MEDEMKTKEITILSVEIGKSGVSQTGKAWQLYKYKIQMDGAERYASGFFEIKLGEKGMYLLKETPNPNNPNSTYLNIVKKADTPQSSGTDLLAQQQPIITNTPVADIKLSAEEEALLQQLKALDQAKVTEQAFKETVAGRISNCGDNRQKELWDYYCEKVRG